MNALVVNDFGAPDVLQYKEIETPKIKEGYALVKNECIGLNFSDIHKRYGRYPFNKEKPQMLGSEGAGVVEEIIFARNKPYSYDSFEKGTRVGYTDNDYSNAEFVLVPIEKLIPLPDHISSETAAAVLLQGLTAYTLVRDSFRVTTGDTVLIHAAAGGVGLLLIQMSILYGARAMGVTSTEEKAEAARDIGADEVFLYNEDWITGAVAHTRGREGVSVVYDSIGTTLGDSLKAIRSGGSVIFFGTAGGIPEPIDPCVLKDESKTITGAFLPTLIKTQENRIRKSRELFNLIKQGKLKITIYKKFKLSEGAEAHSLLESRKSIGKIIFTL